MSKIILFDDEARRGLEAGVDKLWAEDLTLPANRLLGESSAVDTITTDRLEIVSGAQVNSGGMGNTGTVTIQNRFTILTSCIPSF